MKNVEDIYPLSPMQQGMLFHTLYAPAAGMYIEQLTCTLRGELDRAAFKRAWQHVVERHPVFRTAFHWEGLDEPMQVVRRTVELPWQEYDWRALPPDEQAPQLAALLAADQARGFVLTSAPLTRFMLLRTAEDACAFVWTHHHLLLDGWSLPLVLGEVFQCYSAFAFDRPLHLPPLRPYRDYIAWLQRQDPAQAEAFWRQTLHGLTAPTPLGVDHPPAPAAPPSYAVQEHRLTPTASAALDEFARQHGLTLNTLVQGAWALLLSRYSGQLDVVFGATVAGRPPELPGSATMVGLFINTLPVRVSLPPAAGVRAWLHALQAQQVEQRQYEYSALVQVQGWSAVPRRLPLFESLLVFENYPVGEAVAAQTSRPRLAVADLQTVERTNYPLTLAVAPSSELLLQISYDGRRFTAATITRMLGHLGVLLAALADAPEARLADLSLLSAAEQTQLLLAWNATAAPYPHDQGLHDLIAAQAARTPDAVAVVFDAGLTHARRRTPHDASEPASCVLRPASPMQLTYAALDAQATQLAHSLRARGVGPEALVAVCLERSLELVVALLGVLKAGAAYLPLDPRYPPARLAFMREDSRASLLITSNDERRTTNDEETHPEALHDLGLTINELKHPDNIIVHRPSEIVHPDNLAYVIYTSGSTGQPKGAMNTHRAIVNRLHWMQVRYQLTADDSVLQKTPYSFDVSVWEFFWPLISGARLVLARPGGHQDPAYLAELIAAARVSTLHFVPSMLQAFLQLPDLSGCRLRRVICSGEALPYELQERFYARLDAELHNLYGPTEAAVDVTAWACEPATEQRVVPIGRPIANTQMYLLDQQLRPVAIGVPGEVYIGGVQLARGYHGRPDLTAERFLPNPFVTAEDERRTTNDEPDVRPVSLRRSSFVRLYKTGDLARFQEDGAIIFLGRIDQQIKLRGFRIELGEIEMVLRQHPAVRDAAVLARDDSGDIRLVAYVVLTDAERRTTNGAEPDSSIVLGPSSFVSELRAFLTERLPDYMVPATILILPTMPLTPSGKLDRRALPAPEPARPELAEPFAAPRTPEEEVVAGIWADLLHLDRVGIHDNFFDLGGHSLLATQAISRLRETFAIALTLRDLFDAPTPTRLTERILIAQRSTAGQLPPPLQPVPRDRPLPLSFAQQRLWFLDQLEPNTSVYNIPSVMRLGGPLAANVLQRSLSELVRRHESLRTSFVIVDGRPVQVIAPPYALPLPLLDLRSLSAAEQATEVPRLAALEDRQPFDLARGPLLRAKLLRLSENEHVALLTLHHIVADGWSLDVLIQELSAVYSAFAAGQPSPLPALPIQYADFAIWQRTWLQGDVLESHLTYWRNQLADLGMLELPTDQPRPASPSFAGAAHEFRLPKELRDGLVRLSRQEGVTLFMTMLAAFQILLARYSDQDDVAVGTPIAGRTWGATEGLIGCFINTLVLRTDLSGNPTVREVARRVREVCLGAYAHQDLPFEQVVEALQPARDLSRHPLFQVLFSLQNAPAGAVRLTNLALSPIMVERRTTQFDLSLFVDETADGLTGLFEYSTDLFLAATITRMLGHLDVLLTTMAAAPETRLADLSLLSAAEQTQLLLAWNATAAPYPHDQGLHDLIAAQAARTPDAVAVVFDAGLTRDERRTMHDASETQDEGRRTQAPMQLTYAALDAQATQLAHGLRARGVGREALVAVCLERSLELVVVLLGVLKAGAAYLPLDPRYPPARLAFMLEDSRAAMLITTSDQDKQIRSHGDQEIDTLPISVSPGLLVAQTAPALPARVVRPDQLAYVIYTSGSTGQPKGVQITQRALVNFLWAMRDQPGLRADDILLSVTTLAFDIAGLELYLPLLVGARLVLTAPETTLDGVQLSALMQRARVTVMQATPTTWRLLLDSGWPGSAQLRALCGGEALPQELAQRLRSNVAALWNLYGPTETTIWSTADELGLQAQQITIGRPIANTQLYLLDGQLRPVPLGVPGEVFIGGAGLARGYLGRPDLTAERFVPNPFATPDDERRTTNDELDARPGVRLYRTGDRARYRADGQLVFLGRRDSQVKLRGFRIELGEIAAALRMHPAVRDAAVRLHAAGDAPQLVAYVVPIADAGRTPHGEAAPASVLRPAAFVQDVRDHLSQQLPAYLLPHAVVVLAALPLTPNGKLDHRALPAPDRARPALTSAFVAPRTSAEATLAAIWARLLRRTLIGVTDNFFALGGDSILSIQIIAAAREAGLYLTPKDMFQHQTVAALAAVAGRAPAVLAEQGLVRGVVPLTPIQHAFFAQDLPAPQHYTQALLLTLRQPLAPALLTAALAALLAQHDALRLRFVATAAGWQQVHADAPAVPVQQVDLRGLAPPRQRAALEGAAAALQRSLDLTHGPLVRVAHFALGADEPARLLLIIHHLLVDGVSWRILLADLHRAATQLAAGEAVQLPPKTSAYQTWAQRLVAYAQSAALRAERAYWLALVRPAGRTLPRDHATGPPQVGTAAEVVGQLTVDETRTLLEDVPAAYHTQINDALLTALVQAVGGWSGEARLLVELEGHGREELFPDVDLTRTIGWFATRYPVLLDVRGAAGPGAALQAVKEQLRAVPQRGIGYGVLRYLAADGADLAVAPEVSFNYLGQVEAGAAATAGLFGGAREATGPPQDPRGLRRHVLEVSGVVEQDALELLLRYSPEWHDRATITRLRDAYLAALRALLAACQAPDAGGFTPSDFPLAQLDQADLDAAFEQITFTEE